MEMHRINYLKRDTFRDYIALLFIKRVCSTVFCIKVGRSIYYIQFHCQLINIHVMYMFMSYLFNTVSCPRSETQWKQHQHS